MSLRWLDNDDRMDAPTDLASLAWAVLFYLLGMGTLIFTPSTDAGMFLLAGYVGLIAGTGFLLKAFRA